MKHSPMVVYLPGTHCGNRKFLLVFMASPGLYMAAREKSLLIPVDLIRQNPELTIRSSAFGVSRMHKQTTSRP